MPKVPMSHGFLARRKILAGDVEFEDRRASIGSKTHLTMDPNAILQQ
jgi:hypothetical protein